MAHWEYGVEYTLAARFYPNGGPVQPHIRTFGEDLERAVREATEMGESDAYGSVGVLRRPVGDWEGFCIKTALEERALRN